jgi:hypothetical protein
VPRSLSRLMPHGLTVGRDEADFTARDAVALQERHDRVGKQVAQEGIQGAELARRCLVREAAEEEVAHGRRVGGG